MPWLAALGALAGLGGAAAPYISESMGSKDLQTERIPPPGDIEAIRRIMSRAIVQNMFQTGPSFQDFVGSGGTATFPINFTGLSPVELRQLRFVGPQGEEIPFGSSEQRALSPAQLLFLGRHDERQGLNTRPARLYRSEVRSNELEKQLSDPNITEKRRLRLENKLARVKERRDDLLSRSTEFGLANIPVDPETEYPGFGKGTSRKAQRQALRAESRRR